MPLIRALAKVNENGQITIPGNIIRTLKIEPGDVLEFRLLPQNKIQLTRPRGPNPQIRSIKR
jgi:AbrB family looped-hinge helix DNA binding protein